MNDKDYILIIFTLLFIIYYITIILNDYKSLFFILAIFFIVYINYIKTNTIIPTIIRDKIKSILKNKITSSQTFINNKETEITKETNGIYEKLFYTSKPLKNINFIKNSKEFITEIYKLSIIKKYDNELFNKIIYMIEHFLRLHYKIMMNYYDFEQFFNTLKDIRNQILNDMKSIIFNIPKLNEDIINEVIDNIEKLTYRYMKILQLKYKKTHLIESEPYEYNSNASNLFDFW